MKTKLTTFQIVLFVFIVLLIIAGVLTFALNRQDAQNQLVPVTMWGTVSEDSIFLYQDAINTKNKDSIAIEYTEFLESEFEDELISALASGQGPDAILTKEDFIIKHQDKLFTIGYDFYSQSDFKNDFIEAGEVLLREQGVLGIPFMVDPLVFYWNRTILNNNGYSQPPKVWAELVDMVPNLTDSDSSANISKATVAMGEFRNVENAKEIFTALVRQAGSPIVTRDPETGGYIPVFEERLGYRISPADAAINFFTQFSNPSKKTYTWNRSLPQSDDMFLSGDLAFYIGLASERNELVQRNPNLNFGIAELPQSSSFNENQVDQKVTGGDLYFLGILNRSPKIGAAYNAFMTLVQRDNMEMLYEVTNLPPVRRDLLSEVPSVDYRDTFNKSALITKPFVDPDSSQTSELFRNTIESVISGRLNVSESLKVIQQELRLIINQ